MPKPRGRPTLDEIARREILAILAVGGSRRTAAAYVGCAVSAIQNAAQRDPQFAAELRRAEYRAEIGYLQNIQNAAGKEQYWRAAAWALERRNPRDFARRPPDAITDAQIKELVTGFVEIIVEEFPAARDRKRILKRLDAFTAACGP